MISLASKYRLRTMLTDNQRNYETDLFQVCVFCMNVQKNGRKYSEV